MATGDPPDVGIAIPMINWRAERDYDTGYSGTVLPYGMPDGWGAAGNAYTMWRKPATAYDYLMQWGLSTLGALAIYSNAAGDYVWCRSAPNSVPSTGDTFNGSAYAWCCPWRVPTDRLKMEVHTLDANGASTGSTNQTSAASPVRARWDPLYRATPNFGNSTSMIQLRFMDGATLGSPTYMMIDAPVVAWDARGVTGAGLRALESRPNTESYLTPGSLASIERDTDQGFYLADPYGATAKWTLYLAWDDMSVNDYQYWLAAYAVNRGASGFKSANGKRLLPMPVAVRHHLYEPIDYSDDLASHYRNSGKPQIIVGNITSFDLSAREHLGWGYQGSITIEEA